MKEKIITPEFFINQIDQFKEKTNLILSKTKEIEEKQCNFQESSYYKDSKEKFKKFLSSDSAKNYNKIKDFISENREYLSHFLGL